ncbi:hypothetical protein CR513_16973, partial [Mucuna pruriens]
MPFIAFPFKPSNQHVVATMSPGLQCRRVAMTPPHKQHCHYPAIVELDYVVDKKLCLAKCSARGLLVKEAHKGTLNSNLRINSFKEGEPDKYLNLQFLSSFQEAYDGYKSIKESKVGLNVLHGNLDVVRLDIKMQNLHLTPMMEISNPMGHSN